MFNYFNNNFNFRNRLPIVFLACFLFCSFFVSNFVFAKEKEIVISTDTGQIIFYNLSGNIVSLFNLPPDLKVPTNIAVGDVDYDFENEIVVTPKQNGSWIAIFDKNGNLKYPIFNSTEKFLSQGQELALGDINDDGKKEIIIAFGGGAPPYIEIFNYQGKLKDKFLAFSKNFREGIKIKTGDIDRDRKDEIIFFKKDSPNRIFFRKEKKILSLPSFFNKKNFLFSFSFNLGDLEGDGKDELSICDFLVSGQCQIASFTNQEGGKLEKWPNNLISNDNIYLNLKDVDNDGRAEAVVSEATGGRVSIYKVNHEVSIWKTIYTLQNISSIDIFSSELKVKAKVIYVDDGDTIFLDNGQEIRYIGMNTTEIGEPFYLEATNKNKELVYGKEVTIEYDKQIIDPFGRYLAYVFSDGIFVNEELLRQGLAKTEFIFPDVKYANKLLKAEKEAKEKKIGLWK